jgi:hypothetical protein
MLEIILIIMLAYFTYDWCSHRDDEKNAKRDADKWR